RVLRYLAANGMIKETDEDCFTSTNVTGVLSTPRFKAGIMHKYIDTMLTLHQLMTDTAYSNPSDFSRSPFQLAHNTDQPAFIWGRNHPERVKFFKLWMTATHEDHKSWLDVFPPERFCDNSHKETVLFVDIGGGVGHQTAALKARLSETHTAGRLILQDRPATIEQALPTEGVEKMEFDFWGQQPIKDARAYYLRNILHDYPDEKCIEILHRTIDAMGAQSLILIDDMVLPNVGAHEHATELDLTMMSVLASMERSEIEWRNLLERAGLHIQTIKSYTEDTRDSIIVATRSEHHDHPS
ncbi:hypothetical protein Q9189_003840, partial [Teloschistes chrysophthalmus]